MKREPIPLNDGLLEPVELIIPEGLLNPPFPDDPALCPAVVGGNGLIREYEFLDNVNLSILSQRRKTGPFGLQGGENGASGTQFIKKTDGSIHQMEGIDNRNISPGERLVIMTPGGGGYGRFGDK